MQRKRSHVHDYVDMNAQMIYDEFLSGMSLTRLAKRYNVSRNYVTDLFIKRYGYVPKHYEPKHAKITSDMLEYAKNEYAKGERSISDIARELNVWRKSLSKQLKEKYNLDIIHDGKKQIDSDYFSDIDTPEKAYWLGFFYADGCNLGYDIEFSLQEKDKKAVYDFREAVHSKHNIQKRTTNLMGKEYISYRIAFKDKKMSSDLSKHGCVPKKSFVIRMPSLPDGLYSHFVRGMFDGDGSVVSYGKYLNVDFTSGSVDMLRDIEDRLKQDIENFCCSYSVDKRRDSTFRLLISRYSIPDFVRYIYHDSTPTTRLERKYLHFKNNAVLRQQLQKSQDNEGGTKRENGCKTATRTEGAA